MIPFMPETKRLTLEADAKVRSLVAEITENLDKIPEEDLPEVAAHLDEVLKKAKANHEETKSKMGKVK